MTLILSALGSEQQREGKREKHKETEPQKHKKKEEEEQEKEKGKGNGNGKDKDKETHKEGKRNALRAILFYPLAGYTGNNHICIYIHGKPVHIEYCIASITDS